MYLGVRCYLYGVEQMPRLCADNCNLDRGRDELVQFIVK